MPYTYTTDATCEPMHCPCCETPGPDETCVNEHDVNADGTATVCGIPIAATTDYRTASAAVASSTISTCETCNP